MMHVWARFDWKAEYQKEMLLIHSGLPLLRGEPDEADDDYVMLQAIMTNDIPALPAEQSSSID